MSPTNKKTAWKSPIAPSSNNRRTYMRANARRSCARSRCKANPTPNRNENKATNLSSKKACTNPHDVHATGWSANVPAGSSASGVASANHWTFTIKMPRIANPRSTSSAAIRALSRTGATGGATSVIGGSCLAGCACLHFRADQRPGARVAELADALD